MKKHFLCVGLISLLLNGCGGGGGTTEDASSSPEESAVTTVTPPAEETTIAGSTPVEDMPQVINDLEENITDENQTVVWSGSTTTTTVNTASGEAPANKGPFKKGSIVTAYKLEDNGSRSTQSLSTETIDDRGTFSIAIPWTGLTEFNVQGEYLNEVTGIYMGGGDLSAVVDMKIGSSNNIGINLFTHMAAEMIKQKMALADANGSTISPATLKSEATETIAEQFNLKLDGVSLEELDVTSQKHPANIQLLQVSAALMSTNDPTATLNSITQDIREDATIDEEGEAVIADLQEEMKNLDLDTIEANIEEHVSGAEAPVDINVLEGTLSWESNISFGMITDASLDTNYSSPMVTVSGVIGESAPISIEGGEFKVNDLSGVTSVSNGDKVEIMTTSSSSYSTTVEALLTIGGKKLPFMVTTQSNPDINDTVPNVFSFGFKKDVIPESEVASNPVIITGINYPTPISIDNGSLEINGQTDNITTVNNGDSVVVKLTAGAKGEIKKATVTIGGIEGKFVVVSEVADKNPEISGTLGSFLDEDLNVTVTSDAIVVSGINVDLPISVTDGAIVSTNTANANSETLVRVSMVTPNEYATKKTVTLYIGDVAIPFTVKTKSNPAIPDSSPEPFSLSKVITQTAGVVVKSEEITVSGINLAVPISVTGATYEINGTASNLATVTNGDKIRLVVTSPDYGVISSATLRIGDQSATFSVKTEKDDQPDFVAFKENSKAVKGSITESNIVTIRGINVPLPVSIEGGEYSIDGGAYTSEVGIIENNQTVQVRLTNAWTPLTTTVARLKVGSMSLPFFSTTYPSVLKSLDTVVRDEDSTPITIELNATNSMDLRYTATPADASMIDVEVVENFLIVTPKEDAFGETNITISALDGQEVVETSNLNIVLKPINDAPEWDFRVPPAIVLEGMMEDDDPTLLVLSATDADGDSLTYSATTLDPSLVQLSVSDTNLTVTPQPNAFGETEILLMVSDGIEEINMTVPIAIESVNDLPVAHPIAVTTPEDTPVEIILDVTDIEGDSLQYGFYEYPEYGDISLDENRVIYTPAEDFVGEDSFSYASYDGYAESNIATVTITVTPENDAPKIFGIPETRATVGMKYQFTPMVDDPDVGTTLTFSISGKPDWLTFDPLTGALSGTPMFLDIGVTDPITISVSDEINTTTLESFEINVSDMPPPAMDLSLPLELYSGLVKDDNGIYHYSEISATEESMLYVMNYDLNASNEFELNTQGGYFLSSNGWVAERDGLEFQLSEDKYIDLLDRDERILIIDEIDLSGGSISVADLTVSMPDGAMRYSTNIRTYGENHYLYNPLGDGSYTSLDSFIADYCDQKIIVNSLDGEYGLIMRGCAEGNTTGDLDEVYSDGSPYMDYAGSWEIKEINNEEILVISPSLEIATKYVTNNNESPLFGEYNAQVWSGVAREDNGFPVTPFMYNSIAMEAMKSAATEE